MGATSIRLVQATTTTMTTTSSTTATTTTTTRRLEGRGWRVKDRERGSEGLEDFPVRFCRGRGARSRRSRGRARGSPRSFFHVPGALAASEAGTEETNAKTTAVTTTTTLTRPEHGNSQTAPRPNSLTHERPNAPLPLVAPPPFAVSTPSAELAGGGRGRRGRGAMTPIKPLYGPRPEGAT
eukprot:89333-Pyramimonas_sp.AAC.1